MPNSTLQVNIQEIHLKIGMALIFLFIL